MSRNLEEEITELAERLASPFTAILDKLNETIDHLNYLKEKVKRLEKRAADGEEDSGY